MILSKETEWSIIEGVSDGQGGLKNHYRWKGNDAIRHTLSSRRAKHLAGYRLIERDVRNIRSWIDSILQLILEIGPEAEPSPSSRQRKGDPKKNDLIKGVFVACIAIYGKMFTGAKGRLVSLNESLLKSDAHIKWHNELMELRHSFVAHSGVEKTETCEIVCALCPHEGRVHHKFFSELTQPNHLRSADYREIDDLLEFIHQHVKKKCDDLWQEIQEKEVTESELNSILQLYGKSGVLRSYIRAKK
jgi:hypothetical protein